MRIFKRREKRQEKYRKNKQKKLKEKASNISQINYEIVIPKKQKVER